MQLTREEFHYAMEHKRRVVDFQYNELKLICETIRASALHLVNIQLPKKHRIKSAKKLIQLPWDSEKTMKAQTPDEMKMMAKWIQLATSSPDNKNKKRVRHFNGNRV